MLASPHSFSGLASSPEAPAKPKHLLIETGDAEVEDKGQDNSGVAGNDGDGDNGNDYHWGCYDCGYYGGVGVNFHFG